LIGDPLPIEPSKGRDPREPAVPAGRLRVRALVQVLACSGIPSQLFVAQLLALAGLSPLLDDGRLNAVWVFALALGDTLLLVGLAWALLVVNGESPRAVFLGPVAPGREALFGAALIVPLVLMAALVILGLRAYWPALHNVPQNPLAGLLASPRDAWLFLVVVLLAGGVREEIQRAFLLTRFERHLGGATIGLLVTSVAFGAGHALQGYDAAVATGLLGLAWGWIYLRRRSAVAPVVSHAGFNTLEIVRFLTVGAASV